MLLTASSLVAMAQDSKTEKIPVAGNCGMCKSTIEKAAKTAGVTDASWDQQTKMLTVKYNETATSAKKIQETVAAAGYDTRDVKGNDAAYKKLHACCQYDREADGKGDKGSKGEKDAKGDKGSRDDKSAKLNASDSNAPVAAAEIESCCSKPATAALVNVEKATPAEKSCCEKENAVSATAVAATAPAEKSKSCCAKDATAVVATAPADKSKSCCAKDATAAQPAKNN
ncbi:MAG: heavy-metal-associated domain-containing protein [Chitinophagaceae bacterium]|nr:MAG: heavy-metal-associated domain-containing protein [Chitinophagaceae bacterium]